MVASAAFGFHSLALDTTGRIWAWGLGAQGQLGNGLVRQNNPRPILVPGLTGVTAIGSGRNHSLAADGTGRIWAWGNNDLGQVGDGGTTNQPSPVLVSTLPGTVQVVGGRDYSAALG